MTKAINSDPLKGKILEIAKEYDRNHFVKKMRELIDYDVDKAKNTLN